MTSYPLSLSYSKIINLLANEPTNTDAKDIHKQNTPLALMLAFCSCFLNASGFIIMKISHMKQAKSKSKSNCLS